MTEISDAPDSVGLVPGVHRMVRTVDRESGPFTGTLVAYEDRVAVCVDAHELRTWGGWAYSATDHVCGVIDLRRRRNGHDALLPWCTQRVETFLGRRRAADTPLAPGEIATLAVSLLRGLRELGDVGSDGSGDWWLTGDGRPLFVHGAGGAVRSCTAGLFERLIPHTTDRALLRILHEMRATFGERRHHEDDDVRWEEELFAIAAPRALRTDVFAPEKAADVRRVETVRPPAESRQGLRRALRESRSTERAGKSRIHAVGQLFRALGGTAIAVVRRFVERVRPGANRASRERAAPTRKKALILAAALAAFVLIVGLMWPEGQEPEKARAAPSAVSSGASDAEGTLPPAEEGPAIEAATYDDAEPTGTAEHAIDAVPWLLEAIVACAESGQEDCPGALSSSAVVPASGPATQRPDESTAELVDDYGDVAVIKLTPREGSSESPGQILVLERYEQKWLVRDIYDVAHQPD